MSDLSELVGAISDRLARLEANIVELRRRERFSPITGSGVPTLPPAQPGVLYVDVTTGGVWWYDLNTNNWTQL